jgi:hypothetical protein
MDSGMASGGIFSAWKQARLGYGMAEDYPAAVEVSGGRAISVWQKIPKKSKVCGPFFSFFSFWNLATRIGKSRQQKEGARMRYVD